ncbi:MAG: hypothetical protein Q7U91_17345 [Sideroxyarcus sp.]|nr:hypothetical protein [Sideroxyarcus sp.]
MHPKLKSTTHVLLVAAAVSLAAHASGREIALEPVLPFDAGAQSAYPDHTAAAETTGPRPACADCIAQQDAPGRDGAAAEGATNESAADGTQQQADTQSASASDGYGMEQFLFPVRTRMGGELGFDFRSDRTGGGKIMQQGETARLKIGADSYLWQPWFAQLGGNLDFSASHRNTGSSGQVAPGSSSSAGQNIYTLNGDARLTVLQQSRFPFNAFYEKGDSRQTGSLGLADDYGFRRAGVTQAYQTLGGANYFASYDRNTQNSERSGNYRQDNIRVEMSKQFDMQHIEVAGSRNTNTREANGERARVDLLSARHSYAPDMTLSVESQANATRSDYRLERNLNDVRLTQVNSNAFWRSDESPLTVNGGLRLLALTSESDSGLGATTAVLNSANANLGAYYEYDRNIRFNASANANLSDNETERLVTSNETLGATYQADVVPLGKFSYDRTVSLNASNRSGGPESGQQLALQASHGVNRNFAMDSLGYLGMNLSQAGTVARDTARDEPRLLQHSGALTWSLVSGEVQTYVRLSASDSRAVGGEQDSVFQLVNFQFSSSQPLDNRSSLNGNLTIQSVRQRIGTQAGAATTEGGDGKFVTSSGADLNYFHQRAFGVPMLRFVSTLTLTSDAFLPVAGGPQDMAQKSWENRFDYAIGRTQLTLSARISEVNRGERNTSIWFTVKRLFGD